MGHRAPLPFWNPLWFIPRNPQLSPIKPYNISYMPVSGSNRVVVEIDQELKRQLYATLALDQCTLKDWFRGAVERFLGENSDRVTAVSVSAATEKEGATLL
jgi:hypothetical protein